MAMTQRRQVDTQENKSRTPNPNLQPCPGKKDAEMSPTQLQNKEKMRPLQGRRRTHPLAKGSLASLVSGSRPAPETVRRMSASTGTNTCPVEPKVRQTVLLTSAETPSAPEHARGPYARKSSFLRRKRQDNQLGYRERSQHRHTWQERRQREYFRYKSGLSESHKTHSSDSD